MKNGDFGSCDERIEQYMAASRQRFPYAAAFRPPGEPEAEGAPADPKEPHSDGAGGN